MEKIVFVGHSIYLEEGKIFDPNYAITYEFLNHYFNSGYRVIRHTLYRGGETRIYARGVKNNYKKIKLIGYLPDSLRYLAEIVFNGIYLLYYQPTAVIAIDPLSCFVPALFKKIGLIKKVFFITPDFTKQRFGNRLLNFFYCILDKFCTLNSDKNLCCSKTVISYKEKIYKRSSGVYVHLPNIPNPWVINRLDGISKIKNRIIYAGNISSQIDFEIIFYQINKLKEKYKNITLYIAGTGSRESYLRQYVKKNKISNIYFLGQLSHEDALKEIAQSEIGVAWYNGAFRYDEFRDSCKIREYQALATIPLVSKVVKANCAEIQRYTSGIVINDADELYNRIDQILSNETYKKELQIHCRDNYLLYSNKFQEFYDLMK